MVITGRVGGKERALKAVPLVPERHEQDLLNALESPFLCLLEGCLLLELFSAPLAGLSAELWCQHCP